jgi:hypothetical protein
MLLDSTLQLLSDLKQDKIIRTEGKRIIVIDWELLKRLARIS